MFAKRVEIENIVICWLLRRLDKLRLFKAIHGHLKIENTEYYLRFIDNIFPCLKSFCSVTSLLFYMLKVHANFYKKFKTRFLPVHACTYNYLKF